MDQLPRLGKRELICLLSFTCNYVVFVWRGFLFLWVLGMGYVILLWHSLSLPYNNSMDQMKIINCTMGDVSGYILGRPHITTPAAVTTNKIRKCDPLKTYNLFAAGISNILCRILASMQLQNSVHFN